MYAKEFLVPENVYSSEIIEIRNQSFPQKKDFFFFFCICFFPSLSPSLSPSLLLKVRLTAMLTHSGSHQGKGQSCLRHTPTFSSTNWTITNLFVYVNWGKQGMALHFYYFVFLTQWSQSILQILVHETSKGLCKRGKYQRSPSVVVATTSLQTIISNCKVYEIKIKIQWLLVCFVFHFTRVVQSKFLLFSFPFLFAHHWLGHLSWVKKYLGFLTCLVFRFSSGCG